MNELTTEIIKEEYKKGLPSAGLQVDNETLKFIQVFHESKQVWNFITKREAMLVSNEIAIFPQIEKSLYSKIVEITESIARRISCNQINIEALDNEDKELLIREGYEFGEGRYIGVKNLK